MAYGVIKLFGGLMRTLILIAAALLIQQQASAAIGQCRTRIALVCEAKYNQPNGTSKEVTSGAGRVYNQNAEFFGLPDCQASVALETDAGTFTANYTDYNGKVTATIAPAEGNPRLLILGDEIDEDTKTSVTVPMLSDEKYDSVTFTCYTQVNYKYQYRYNPGE